MSRIYKTTNSESIPEWVDAQNETKQRMGEITAEDWKRISASNLDDEKLVVEFDAIEKCASSKKPYFYNSNWDNTSTNTLKEFAYVNQCQAIPVNVEDKEVKAYLAVNLSSLEKTASAAPVAKTSEKKPIIPFELIDAFHLDEKGNTDFLKKTDWEKVTTSAKLTENSRLSSGIKRLDGGIENHNISPHLNIKPGQNSVTRPEAIDELSKGAEDSGERLKRENAERKEERNVAHKEWEKEAMVKAEGFGSLSFNTIKKTEASYCNPGIKDNPVRNAKEIPDKTDGEMLKEKQQARKASIQRASSEDKSWDSLENQYQSTHVINDSFSEILKEKLANIKKK